MGGYGYVGQTAVVFNRVCDRWSFPSFEEDVYYQI
jgi:hypothetical protein